MQTVARLLPLCLMIACRGETTSPTPAPASPSATAALVADNVVASVAVVPDSQMVFIGERFTITARPKNAAGQLLDRSIRWTVSDTRVAKALDSLKATMSFKALRAGATSIKATVDGMFRSSKVVARSVVGASVVLTPASATVATGGKVTFVATGLTQAGETAVLKVTWSATGGTISGSGVLAAGNTAGTYRVIATSRFGAADTSTVTVTVGSSPVATVTLLPATTSVLLGGSTQFLAYGRTQAGDSVKVTVTYTATGGTIAAAGLYTAGATAGTYRVIARSSSGPADTSAVVISPAAFAGVTLMPDVAASRSGATTRFVASVWNTLGQSVPEPVTYRATCGTVTTAGVFTQAADGSDRCLVIASAAEQADTTEVRLLPNVPGQGIPFGLFGLWATSTTLAARNVAPYTASHDAVSPADLIRQIAAARAYGVHMVIAMTGGSHEQFKTNGVFDPAKWHAQVDGFNTPAIRDAVADAVSDGTILGNSVMDEPQQSDRGSTYRDKSWGPAGTMTKARVDGLCAYVKGIFPTLPVGVVHDPLGFEPENSYRVCEFLESQYAQRKGDVRAWRDAALRISARDGMVVLFSLNLINGGQQDTDGTWDCRNTGGLGWRSPNCSMTPSQIREWGQVLGQAGCAMLAWMYDAAFLDKPENQAALSEVAVTLSRLPRRPCTGHRVPNALPVAEFASNCTELTCGFTDGSTDADGQVTAWSWDFGDGTLSPERQPSHTYGAEGLYQVTLTVTDDANATGQVTHTVAVSLPRSNTPPEAAFTSTCSDLDCSFTDGSADADGTVESWSWDFGDGTTSTERDPTHSYAVAGQYLATLTITDNGGATASVQHEVTVTAAASP